jgi:hypothetical protein
MQGMPPMLVRMSARIVMLAAVLAAFAAVGVAVAARTPAQARAIAERNVLRALGHNWNPRRIPQLVNARTGLARDNVQARCHRVRHTKAGVFSCVVRPGDPDDKTRLYLRYRQLTAKKFVVHWIELRK